MTNILESLDAEKNAVYWDSYTVTSFKLSMQLFHINERSQINFLTNTLFTSINCHSHDIKIMSKSILRVIRKLRQTIKMEILNQLWSSFKISAIDLSLKIVHSNKTKDANYF